VVSFLEGSLAEEIYQGFKEELYAVTLHTITRTRDSFGEFTTSETDVSGIGFIDDYKEDYKARAQIPSGDMKGMILQKSMTGTRPKKDDRFTARGEKFTIIEVMQDPAQATWEMQLRPFGNEGPSGQSFVFSADFSQDFD
jgi:hypothetical protein